MRKSILKGAVASGAMAVMLTATGAAARTTGEPGGQAADQTAQTAAQPATQPTTSSPQGVVPPGITPELSDKDKVQPTLAEFDSPFPYDGRPLAPLA